MQGEVGVASLRKFLIFLTVLLVFLPFSAWPVGLGNIEIFSAIGQPLDAEVPIIELGNVPLSDIRVGFANGNVFKQFNIPFPTYFRTIEFHPAISSRGRPVIHITSSHGISVPFLRFLVQLRWPQGQLVREYTVLLDPRGYRRPRKPPKRFYYKAPRTNTRKYLANPVSNYVEPEAEKNENAITTTGVYGPTSADDTLIKIARKARPDNSVSIDQTMVAIFRANPKAFINGNINELKSGERLILPTLAQIKAIDEDTAKREVQKEDKQWENEHEKNQHNNTTSNNEPAITTEKNHPQQNQHSLPLTNSGQPTKEPEKLVNLLNQPNAQTETNAVTQKNVNTTTSQTTQQLEQELAITNQQVQTEKESNQILENKVNTLEQENQKLEKELANDNAEITAMKNNSATGNNASGSSTSNINLSMNNFGKEFDHGEMNSSSGGILNSNMLSILIIAGAIILLLIFAVVYLMLKQKRQGKGGGSGKTAALGGPKPMATPVDADIEDDDSAAEETTGSDDSNDSADNSEPAKSEHANLDVSALDEVDLYITYEKFEQAKTVLQSVIEKEPDNAVYQAKMLEVIAAKEGWQVMENYLHDLPQGLQDSDAIKKTLVMLNAKDDIDANSLEDDELTSVTEDEFDLGIDNSDKTLEGSNEYDFPNVESPADDDEVAAIILDVGDEVLDVAPVKDKLDENRLSISPSAKEEEFIEEKEDPSHEEELPVEEAKSTEAKHESNDLDFDPISLRLRLIKVYANAKNQEAFEAAIDKLPDDLKTDDNAMWQEILTLKESAFGEGAIESDDKVDTKVEETHKEDDGNTLSFKPKSVEAAIAAEKDQVEQVDVDDNEMSIEDKLSLAQTYIDMDDMEGAREILNEIMTRGDEKHKMQAEDMLKKLDE